ncbi:NUDIX domain-containing protein [Meiothermus sp.]|uniref:NUDIX hydrolase n=1 Tax=Meiothermus sp. TaxID=1955249 RepID=UPI0021DC0AC1|nr:NUDIX domain-containing protein [Meiothermus sp.]GIW25914.1 MAG: NUDIX hydrolase [Meiothermus sp.]
MKGRILQEQQYLDSYLQEQQYLDSYDASAFDRPSVTVDVVILTVREGHLEALLVKRKEHPFLNYWSLPGGFVRMHESLDEAATRVLRQKAGLEGVTGDREEVGGHPIYLEQLYTFGNPERDPRTRVISVAYYALVEASHIREVSEETALFKLRLVEETGHVEIFDGKHKKYSLAFDHAEILGVAVRRIQGKLGYTPIGFELLPERFTLRELQAVHETILQKKLNKDSFRRKMLASGLLEATGEFERGKGFRPAELYRFRREA